MCASGRASRRANSTESTGSPDYKTAQRRLRGKLHAIDKGEPIEPSRRHQVSCEELYTEELRDYRVKGQKSIDALQRRWNHLKPMFADRAARNFNDDALNAYLDQGLDFAFFVPGARCSEKAAIN